MNICPVCALTGWLSELQVVRVMPGGALPASVDWYCQHCHTTGHNPALTPETNHG